MFPKTDLRDDEFRGTTHKSVEIVIQIIKAIREATSPKFAIGMKIDSVDAAQSGDTNRAFVKQGQRIVDAGFDFLEVSGGTYEKADVRSSVLNVARKGKLISQNRWLQRQVNALRVKEPSFLSFPH